MEQVIEKQLTRVYGQQINGKSAEDYIAELCEKIEKDELEKEKLQMQISALKQLNNRHKNIIDAQRVELNIEKFKKETQQEIKS